MICDRCLKPILEDDYVKTVVLKPLPLLEDPKMNAIVPDGHQYHTSCWNLQTKVGNDEDMRYMQR